MTSTVIMGIVLFVLLLWVTCDFSTKVRVGVIAVAGIAWLVGLGLIPEGLLPQLLLTASVAILSFIFSCSYNEPVDEKTEKLLSDDPEALIEQIRANDREAAEKRVRFLGKKHAAGGKSPASTPRTTDRVNTTDAKSVSAKIKRKLAAKADELDRKRLSCTDALRVLTDKMTTCSLQDPQGYREIRACLDETVVKIERILCELREDIRDAEERIAMGSVRLDDWRANIDQLEDDTVDFLAEVWIRIMASPWHQE